MLPSWPFARILSKTSGGHTQDQQTNLADLLFKPLFLTVAHKPFFRGDVTDLASCTKPKLAVSLLEDLTF